MVTRTSSPNSAGLPASQSDDQVTETTRLLGGTHLEATARGGNGEWDGSADFEGLPWWRRPSVSSLIARLRLSYSHLMTKSRQGILAAPAVFHLHPCLWQCHGAQSEPVRTQLPFLSKTSRGSHGNPIRAIAVSRTWSANGILQIKGCGILANPTVLWFWVRRILSAAALMSRNSLPPSCWS